MYFDPGMGSLIIQTIIAVIAVVGGYFAYAKSRLKGKFSKKKDNKEGENENSNPEMKEEEDNEL